MNSTLKWKFLWVTFVLASMPIFAKAQVIDHHWYVAMDAGGVQANMPGAMTVPNGSDYPPPANVDHYSVDSLQTVMLDIQAGQRWYRDAIWIPSYAFALRYEHLFKKNITGMVNQYSDPAFTTYSYTWGVSADVISLYSKFDLARYNRFMVYVDAGLGLSFLQAHAYNETALPTVWARDNPNYASKTNYQFSYNVGAGLDYTLDRNFLLSVGYSYQSFGNLSSGFGQGPDWNDTRLHLGRLNANMVFAGLSYLIDLEGK